MLPDLGTRYDPLEVERWVSHFWTENDIPRKARKRSLSRAGAPLFRFLEGPPTANGFMHVGHARGRTLKDIVLRYYRMKGYRVWDQAGWDTQGLPVELEVEKELGFRTKKDIEAFGVEKFIEECQKLVDYYIDHWRKASERLALWLDYDNAYETRHPRYLDAVWRFLKEMWEKGMLYEDLRVVPVCPRCETALSTHELALGYEVVKDPSLYFKVRLEGEPAVYLIAWTTTPWTIISNEALAVHPDETYVVLEVGDEKWVIAEKRLEAFVAEVKLERCEVVRRLKGKDLVGRKYVHPLLEEVPEHAKHDGEWEHGVVAAGWVSMEEGTGIVHTAPAHGAEDFELGRGYGLRVFTPLQKNGYFSERAGKYEGLWFKNADAKVIEDLEAKGLVVHAGLIEHEYPHCWRCETPLMYRADRQWFIKVDFVKKRMVKENEGVRWFPGWAKRRFGDWLESARDWCISRERYWGTPLPIWTCKSCGRREAFGSLEELRTRASDPSIVVDHHRPWVDRVKLICPDCGGVMEREPFVVDVWLDSGMAHTAALEQYGWGSKLEELMPYDWITEAVDQTRGWFYTLMFTSAALYGAPPYKSVLCQGLVLDKLGKKMSKSKGNVIWALEFMERHGADPMRVYLVSKAAPWDDLNFDPEEVENVRRQLDILWNSARFAKTYMDLDKWTPAKLAEDLENAAPEDKWVLYELQLALDEAALSLEAGNPHLAARALLAFVVEKLSRRYIAVTRPKVWIEEDRPEKRAAYAALFLALTGAIKALAPLAPYVSEYLHQAFTRALDPGAEESVHMERWPSVPEGLLDERAWRAVSAAFEAAEAVLVARAKAGVKRRWPVRRVVVVAPKDIADLLPEAEDVLKVHANVKSVEVMTSPPEGPLEAVEARELKVYVDLTLDEETVLEGLAREVIRRIQVVRKELDLPMDAVVPKALLYVKGERLKRAIERHEGFIKGETRVAHFEFVGEPPSEARKWSVEGEELYVRLVLESSAS